MSRKFTPKERQMFWTYWDVADELWGGLTRKDLDARYYKQAEEAGSILGLSLPPYLPEAETFAQDNPDVYPNKPRRLHE